MDSAQIQKIGTDVAKTTPCDLDDIVVGDRLRPLDENKVKELMTSIKEVGLLHTISVRIVDQMEIDGESYNLVPILVEGLHRREALLRLGVKSAHCRVLDVDEVGAELIEIAENLHLNDLNKLQRDEQLARWIELTELRVSSYASQVATHKKKGQQPGGINAASRELGVSKDDAHRAVKVASLSEEAKDAARETGLDNNRTALLEAAKAPKEEQATVIRDIAEKKAADRNKIDADVKARAAREVAKTISEFVPGEWWDAVKANLYSAGATNIANELANVIAESIMDRRYGS